MSEEATEPRTPKEIFNRLRELYNEHSGFPYEIGDLKSRLRAPSKPGPHLEAYLVLHEAYADLDRGMEKLGKYLALIDEIKYGDQ